MAGWEGVGQAQLLRLKEKNESCNHVLLSFRKWHILSFLVFGGPTEINLNISLINLNDSSFLVNKLWKLKAIILNDFAFEFAIISSELVPNE